MLPYEILAACVGKIPVLRIIRRRCVFLRYTYQQNKPSSGIYRHLLSTYGLDAASCVFFDDVEENVRGAEREGITGVVFTGVECVREFLQ
jgi:HAD superfamily hydrolase (TIGR01509 family)